MGLRSRRDAARSGSNLGHFPAQFEPNSATLYIIRRPPTAPVRLPAIHLSLTLVHYQSRSPAPPEISPHWKFCACVWGRAGGGQSAGRTWANKIDFLSARHDTTWRHCLLLSVKCGHRFSTDYRDATFMGRDFYQLPFFYKNISWSVLSNVFCSWVYCRL